MRYRFVVLCGLLLLCLLVTSLSAKEATPVISDPQIASRVAVLTAKLRCLVCQGQSVADSGSDFSNDIRREVRLLMEQGKSDREVNAFLVARYGNFILFEPPVESNTLLLWYGPFALLLLGGGVLFVVLKRRSGRVSVDLSPEEVAMAERLLSDRVKEGKES